MTDYMKEAERLPELHREIVDDALEVVDTFGPWGMDINEDLRRQIVLADEVRQLRKLYSAAVKGRQEMRSALRDARAALLAHIQRGAVPEGYDIAPTFRGYAKLGIGQYVLHNCPRTDEDHPSLVIAIATEEEKAGRQVGELRQSQPGLMIQPERIAVRIDFKSVAALDALEQQLRFLREDSFPDSLTAAAPDHFRDAAEMVAEPADDRIAAAIHYPECWDAAAYPTVESALSEVYAHYRCTEHDAPAEVPMPEPTVETYEGYRDSAGVWHPKAYSADQMRTYGDAREAAGYARGLAEAGWDAERYRWLCDVATEQQWVELGGYTVKKIIDGAIDALRGEVKP